MKTKYKKCFKYIYKVIIMITFFLLLIKVLGINSVITKLYFKKMILNSNTIITVILLILTLNNRKIKLEEITILKKVINILLLIPLIINVFSVFIPDRIKEFKENLLKLSISMVLFICIIRLIIYMFKIIKFKNKIKLNVENNQINIPNCIPKELFLQKNNKKSRYKTIHTETKKENRKIEYKDTTYYISNRLCPKCHAKLVSRYNSYEGTYFLGCSNFENTGCNFTINYHEYYKICDICKRK